MRKQLDFRKYRSLFPVTRKWNYLYTGAAAALATPVKQAIENYLKELTNEGVLSYGKMGKDNPLYESLQLFSRLINCDIEELAGVPSASYGINMIALMAKPKPGENVVTNDLEFHSNMYPWLKLVNEGIEVRVAKSKEGRLSADEIERYVDENTRIVTAAHVSTWTGYRQDLGAVAKVAHSHNAYLVVDAVASTGVVDVNVKDTDVDFLTTSTHKWLHGIQGAGFMYVKKSLVDKFTPPLPGWYGTPTQADGTMTSWDKIVFPQSTTKFEVGTPAVIARIAVAAGMKLLFKIGLRRVQKRVSDLTQYTVDELAKIGLKVVTPAEREERGGDVNVLVKRPGTAWNIQAKLYAKKIRTLLIKDIEVAKYGWKTGGLQVSPCFFNTEDEIDQLVKQIKTLL